MLRNLKRFLCLIIVIVIGTIQSNIILVKAAAEKESVELAKEKWNYCIKRFDSTNYYFNRFGNKYSSISFLMSAVEESKITVPKLSKTNITLLMSKTVMLKTIGKIQKVKWTSKNKKIATVSKKGKVTAKRKGKTTIIATVKYKNGNKTKTKKLKCIVKVVDKYTLNEVHKAVENYLKKHYKDFVCYSDEDLERDGEYIFTIRSTAGKQANVLVGYLTVDPNTGIGVFESYGGDKEKWNLM